MINHIFGARGANLVDQNVLSYGIARGKNLQRERVQQSALGWCVIDGYTHLIKNL